MAGRTGRLLMRTTIKRLDRYCIILPVVLASGLCSYAVFARGVESTAGEDTLASAQVEDATQSYTRSESRRERGRSGPERGERGRRDRDGRDQWRRHMPPRVREMLKDPEKRKELWERLFGEDRMERMKNDNPELYKLTVAERELEQRVHEIARNYHEATGDATKKELRVELEAEHAKLFDLGTERHAGFLELLRQRLTRVETALDDRRNSREKLVKEGFERLLSSPPPEPPPWKQFHRGPRPEGGPPPGGPTPDGGPPPDRGPGRRGREQ